MNKMIAVSVVHKRDEKSYYHGSFIVSEEDLKILYDKNPKIILKDSFKPNDFYHCKFSDFTIKIQSEDQDAIERLVKGNVASLGYDLIEILDEETPNWRE